MAPLIRRLLIVAVVAAGLYLIWPKPAEVTLKAPAVAPAAEAEEKVAPKDDKVPSKEEGKKRAPQSTGTAEVAKRDGALNRLEKASQKSWTPIYDLSTKRLKTLKDGVLDLEPITPREKSDEFIRQFSSELFGVDPKNLSYDRAVKTDRVKVIYQQNIGGIRVFSGTLALVYDDNNLMRIQNDLSALPVEPSASVMTVADAERHVQALGGENIKGPPGKVTLVVSDLNLKTELVYFPSGSKMVLAYQMIVDVWKDSKSNERMKVLVSAHDGSFIQSRSLRVD